MFLIGLFRSYSSSSVQGFVHLCLSLLALSFPDECKSVKALRTHQIFHSSIRKFHEHMFFSFHFVFVDLLSCIQLFAYFVLLKKVRRHAVRVNEMHEACILQVSLKKKIINPLRDGSNLVLSLCSLLKKKLYEIKYRFCR